VKISVGAEILHRDTENIHTRLKQRKQYFALEVQKKFALIERVPA
jgi:hypothetical protein